MSADGCVYAVQTAPGRVKLGYTKDLSRRLQAIEGHAGEALLLRHEPGDREHERRLHHACHAHRITREFFVMEGAVADYVQGGFSVGDLGPVPQRTKPAKTKRQSVRWTAEQQEAAEERVICERQERRMREAYADGGWPWPADGNAVLIHLTELGPDPLHPTGNPVTLAGPLAIGLAMLLSANGAAIITETLLFGKHALANQLREEMERGRMAAAEWQIQAAKRQACPAHVLESARSRWHYRQRSTGLGHFRDDPKRLVAGIKCLAAATT